MFKRFISLGISTLLILWGASLLSAESGQDTISPQPPSKTVKLIFIHHSTGENWLADYSGKLAKALRDNNYFTSDTNYGWGPNSIGDLTDIGHWWTWFNGPNSNTYTKALYTEYNKHSDYPRLPNDPGGENEIIVFKSCFPNSHIGGKPKDKPIKGANPLRGQDCYSPYHKVANVKRIYKDLLGYFKKRQDKLFILITSPPLVVGDTDKAHAANARAVHNWLIKTWLKKYSKKYNNVRVFDFYNVLTSNRGNRNKHDAKKAKGNHHRIWKNEVQHLQTKKNNYSSYGMDPWDSHPTAAGGQKASIEFIKLLNVWYNIWNAGK
jgi:hypothetical protein